MSLGQYLFRVYNRTREEYHNPKYYSRLQDAKREITKIENHWRWVQRSKDVLEIRYYSFKCEGTVPV